MADANQYHLDCNKSVAITPSYRKLGFIPHVMTSSFIPYRDKGTAALAGGVYVYSRLNGKVRVTITTPVEAGGLPYGTLPRLMIAWLSTEAVKTKSREIYVGSSLATFLKSLGLHSSGGKNGTIGRFKLQTVRLFSSSISSVEINNTLGKLEKQSLDVIDTGQLWWDPRDPNNPTKWDAYVRLGKEFYDAILARPVPIDIDAIRAIKASPMAIDLYCWLTYRMYSLRRRLLIHWSDLYSQFGGEYARERKFREVYKKQMLKVLSIYPDARVEFTEEGTVLRPSRTHIRT